MKHKKKILAVMLMTVIFVLGIFSGLIIASPDEVLIEANSFQTEASYIVFKSGTTTYARNGATGEIDFSGSVSSTIINYALGNLTSGRTYKEKVLIKGNYEITSALRVYSFTILLIDGLLTLADSTNENLIENADLADGNTYIDIIGGYLNGNGENQVDGNDNMKQCGILFRGVRWFQIRDMFIYQTYYANIRVVESTNSISSRNGFIHGNHLQNTTLGSQSSADNISLRGVSSANPTRNVLITDNICLDAARTAIELSTGCQSITIRGNLIRDAGRGIGPHGTGPAGITYDVIVADNIVRDCGSNGIKGGAIENFFIINNDVFDNGGWGIEFAESDAKNGTICGGFVRNNANGAVNVTGSSAVCVRDVKGYNPVGFIEDATWGASAWTFTNNYSVPIDVYITGGTISGITKDGEAINTSGWIYLDCLESIIITYSVAGTLKVFGQ